MGWGDGEFVDRGHPVQRHDQFRFSRIHIHLPDTRLAGSVLPLVLVLDADVISPRVHALEIVGQRGAAVG